MNLAWLEDFLVLASTGNFSRAAEARHMTQPAFSRRIRALEQWLDTDLFDRRVQPARLTDTGEWFRSVAEELLAQVARVPGEARSVAEASASTLSFAATHALSLTFLPPWLRSLEASIALGPVQLVSDVLQRCEAALLQSKVQFVLTHAHPMAQGPLDTASHASVEIGSDLLVPVSAPDAQGQPRHAFPQRASRRVPLLTYSVESGLGRIVRGVAGAALEALPVQVVFTAHLASVLRTLVLDGRGLAWLPLSLIEQDLTAGRLVTATPDAWRIPLQIRLYRDRKALPRAAEAFWEAARPSLSAPAARKRPSRARRPIP